MLKATRGKIMKCYWCGKENKNLEIDEQGKILSHFPCDNCNQPERSKREDSKLVYKKLFNSEVPKGLEKILKESWIV